MAELLGTFPRNDRKKFEGISQWFLQTTLGFFFYIHEDILNENLERIPGEPILESPN